MQLVNVILGVVLMIVILYLEHVSVNLVQQDSFAMNA
jgi:hypothetical protein